jgi:hypothetical protein
MRAVIGVLPKSQKGYLNTGSKARDYQDEKESKSALPSGAIRTNLALLTGSILSAEMGPAQSVC